MANVQTEDAAAASPNGSTPAALPWLNKPLSQALQSQRGHALLLHAAPGNGALPLALLLAQSWLCEAAAPSAVGGQGAVAAVAAVTAVTAVTAVAPASVAAAVSGAPAAAPACGVCGSCKLVQATAHPDLFVLLPEVQRRELGWLIPGVDKPDEDSKRKPSKQIRIDAVRALIDWSTRTSARGRGKVALLHPAEALNVQSANALLKTLEEPAAGTRLLLTAGDPALPLPTVRSRCQVQRVAEPAADTATAWLVQQGIPSAADAHTLLAACSGRPLDALALAGAGVGAQAWAALPAAVARGNAAALGGWPVPRALDALHKLCHDAMSLASGGQPRYFPAGRVPAHASLAKLSAWSRELGRVARHDDHPWHEGLLLDALVQAGASALQPVVQGAANVAGNVAGNVGSHAAAHTAASTAATAAENASDIARPGPPASPAARDRLATLRP